MTAPAFRINARLTGDDAKRFQDLLDQEKSTVTDVIRESVRERHEKRIKPRKSAYQLLLESGLIGCIKDAPPDLSANKKYLDEHYARKYPRHARGKK